MEFGTGRGRHSDIRPTSSSPLSSQTCLPMFTLNLGCLCPRRGFFAPFSPSTFLLDSVVSLEEHLSIDRITSKTKPLSKLQIVVAMTQILAQATPPVSPPTKHLFRVYMTTFIWTGFIAISSLALTTIFWETVHAPLQWGTYPIIGIIVGLLANRSVCAARLACLARAQVSVKEHLGHNIKYADLEEEQDCGYFQSTRPNFSRPLDALDHVGAARMSTLGPLQKV